MAGEDLREQIRRRAAYLKDLGLDYALDRAELLASTKKPPASPAPERAPAPPARRTPSAGSHRVGEGLAGRSETPRGVLLGASQGSDDPASALDLVRKEIGDCRRCRLCEKRNSIVFGVGDPAARIMFIGEGPGADEDRQGIPFVGRAGQLLTDIITKGMGLRRDQVYIANVVKCRPPDNREPLPDEVAQCFPFLDAQIAAIRPSVIVGLGKSAVQALLAAPVQITKARGHWTDYKGTPLMPTFHPSYLLRNPAAKREVWLDIQEVMRRVGLTSPKKEKG